MSLSSVMLPAFQPSRRDAFRLGLGATALLAGVGIAGTAKAMGVTPFVIDLGRGGNGYSSSVTVENNFKTPLPVEIRVESLSFDTNGVVESHQDPGDLVIFPTQALIQPGQSRVFRIQYAGTPPTDISKHYYVTATQLPVDMGGTATEVQVVYAFNVLVSIPVPGVKAALKVLKASIATDTKNPQLFTPIITIENKTNTYGYFKDGRLKLTQTDAKGKTIFKQTFDAVTLGHIVGFGLIGPGQTRDLPFNVALPSAEGTLKAEYTYAGG